MSLVPIVSSRVVPSFVSTLGEGLLSLLAPTRCAACRGPLAAREVPPGDAGAWRALVCPPCRGDVEPIAEACPACGASRGRFAAPAPRCAACRNRPLEGLARTAALLRYRGAARHLLHRLKYGGRGDLGAPLGRALGARVRALGGDPPPDLVVVPIPLHPWRRLVRGYNQAACVAEGVALALERPVCDALARARRTRALYGVRREARDAEVAGAFRALLRLDGRPALLVDDIRTSGATLRAAAQVLLAAGARRVEAAVVGR